MADMPNTLDRQTSPPGPSRRRMIRRGSFTALAVIQASWILAYMDYNIYNFLLPMILEDLEISIPTAGLIFFLSGQGIVLGSILLPILADKIGRLKTMIVNVLSFSIATALIPLASAAWHLIGARFVVSAAVGGEQPVGAAYVAEEWASTRRARALSFMQSGAAVGTLLATIMVATLGAILGWRIIFLLGLIPAFLVLIIRFFMPESEKWQNAVEERRKAETAEQQPEQNMGSVIQLFSARYRRATLLGVLLLILGNSAAGGIFAWYPTYLSVERGLDIGAIGWYGSVLAVGMFVGYNAFGWAADALGRRPAFAITFVLGIISIIAFTTVTSTLYLGVATFITGVSLAAIFSGYVVYLTELFETPVRATGTGFCMGVGLFFWGLIPFVMSLIAPDGNFSTVFVGIGAGSLLLSLLVMPFAPETKGRQIV